MSLEKQIGKIVYKFATPYDPKAEILYVNVIPNYACTNSCLFCSREDAARGLPNIYEQKAGTSLYLPKAPELEGLIQAIENNLQKRFFHKTREIAIVGLGEPLLQYELLLDVIYSIRKNGYKGTIRLDTNGFLKVEEPPHYFSWPPLVEGNKHISSSAGKLKLIGLDEIRISLNAINRREYEMLCRPKSKPEGYDSVFDKVIKFAKDCVKAKIRTKLSFVTGFEAEGIKTRSEEEYIAFAKSLGVKRKNVILRKYIPPISNH